MVRTDRRRSECVNDWSFEVVDSRSSIIESRFSEATTRRPPGTAAGTPMQDTEPFWVPWTPAPLVMARQRASR